LSVDATELLICFNPSAGSRGRHAQVAEIQAELIRGGYSVQSSTSTSEITELATKGSESGRLRAVLACGGDGTARLLRRHVPLEIPLLPVPMGTECLLSRYLEQSALVEAVYQTLDRGVIVDLDLGRVRDSQANDDYFLMMISAGFDAAVIRRLHADRRGHITRFSYLQPILQTIRSYEYPEMRLYYGDAAESGREPDRCRWLFGFNLPLYALGWQFAAHASGIDSQLDVCTFQHGSFLDGVRYLWHVVRQSHLHLPDMEMTRGQRLRIEGTDGAEIPFQLDGDFAGVLPVELEVLPAALRLLVMPHVAEKLGFGSPEQ
jgi:diacylglycerol kinase (ATP)